jgi:hypothetical protein
LTFFLCFNPLPALSLPCALRLVRSTNAGSCSELLHLRSPPVGLYLLLFLSRLRHCRVDYQANHLPSLQDPPSSASVLFPYHRDATSMKHISQFPQVPVRRSPPPYVARRRVMPRPLFIYSFFKCPVSPRGGCFRGHVFSRIQ